MFKWLERLVCKIFDLVPEEEYEKLVSEQKKLNEDLSILESNLEQRKKEIKELNLQIDELLEKLEELENQNVEYKVTFQNNPDVTFYVNDEKVEIESEEKSKALKYTKGTKLKVYAKANDPKEQDKIKLYIEEDKQ